MNTASVRARFIGGIVDFGLAIIVYLIPTFVFNGGIGEVLSVIFQAANWIVLPATSGQTLGMKLMKMKFVSKDGKDVTWALVIERFFCMVLSVAIVMIGFVPLLLNKRVTLHDLLVGTEVMNVQ